jgi:hypothetical protein
MLYCAFCRENLETMAEVRLQTYEDVADKLKELEVEKNDGSLTPGGIFKRAIFSVPAKGPSSSRQDIPRGESCIGAQKDMSRYAFTVIIYVSVYSSYLYLLLVLPLSDTRSNSYWLRLFTY